MLPLILAAVLAVAAPVVEGEEDGPRYLAVANHVWGQDRASYSMVYPSIAAAQAAAEHVALCGFWRVDLGTGKESLVAPGSIQEIALMDLNGTPPAPPTAALGDPLPLPPPPDLSRIVDCPAAFKRRLGVR